MAKKIRVNITVDAELLEKTKKKLDLFGGKLSTLFNLYLKDFVESMATELKDNKKETETKIKDIETRLAKLEHKIK